MHVGDIDVMIDVYIYIYCLLQWNVIFFCNSRGLCRVPWARHSAKIFQKKKKILCRVPCRGTRQSIFFQKNSEILCRVPKQGHSAKKLFKKNFAECLGRGTRQSTLKKTLPSAWAGALGKVI